MLDTEFLQLTEKELIKISDFIEKNDKNSIFDIEYADGILNIEIFDKNQIYVINKHSASQKIWFSSPISGANYFSYQNNKWLDNKGMDLQKTLITELENNFNFKIQ